MFYAVWDIRKTPSKLPAPVSKEATHELMQLVDLVVVTGLQNNVRASYRAVHRHWSGGPAMFHQS
ncbi:MAG: hypothetical protein Ct9H300mP21_00120 [Pseudomonadota bacterium]|nr:MAG: hypothetical protein Ct9H300mP21_00120 [Pseudomonadota bacterium]